MSVFSRQYQRNAFADKATHSKDHLVRLRLGHLKHLVKCYRPATPDTFATVAAKEFRFLSAFGTEVDRIIEELRQ